MWSLADQANAPVSTGARGRTEQVDDLQAQAYDSSRVMMEANAAQELKELTRRSRERVAYDAESCTLSPLTSKFDAARAAICAENAVRAATLMAEGATEVSVDPPTSSSSTRSVLASAPAASSASLTTSLSNSIKGMVYDLQHYKELPPAKAGLGALPTLSFAVSRDGRLPYVITTFAVMLVALAAFSMMRRSGRRPTPTMPLRNYTSF